MAAATAQKDATAVGLTKAPPTVSFSRPSASEDQISTQKGAVKALSRSLLVILHGKRVDDDLLREALGEIKREGHHVSVRVTFESGDVERFISEAIVLNDAGNTNFQTIVAGGGDGTLNEAVAALMKHRDAVQRQGLSVALIPLGTANDFACTTGISMDPREALRMALDPSLIKPIDVATVNGRPFLNVAVAGGLAEVPADELSSKWKRLLGPVAIAFHVLQRLSSKRALQSHAGATITFNLQPARCSPVNSISPISEGSKPPHDSLRSDITFETDLLMLVAGNSRQMGRTVSVCPDALLDDGLLDFTILTGSSLAKQAAVLLSALATSEDGDSALSSGISQLRASRLEVRTKARAADTHSSRTQDGTEGPSPSEEGDTIPVNRDGEPEAASSRLVFEVLPQALRMHLPDDRLLVSGQDKQQPTPSTSCIRGSVKCPGRDTFVPAAAAMPRAPRVSDARGSRRGGGRRRARGLTVKTLRRMLEVAGPEGGGARYRAQLAAVGRKLCGSLGIMLVGGVLGWLVSSRAAKAGQTVQQQETAGTVAGTRLKKTPRRASHHTLPAPAAS